MGGEEQGGRGLLIDEVPNAQTLTVDADTRIDAGAIGAEGDGGTVILWADSTTTVEGDVAAAGGADGGDGGFVEVSAGETWRYDNWATSIDVSAPNGQAGTFLLDPNDILITDIAAPSTITNPEDATDSANTLLAQDIADFLNNVGSLVITTSTGTGGNGDITFAITGFGLNINVFTTNDLTLIADRDIIGDRFGFENFSGGGGLTLRAGRDIALSGIFNRFFANGGTFSLEAQRNIDLGIPINSIADFVTGVSGDTTILAGGNVNITNFVQSFGTGNVTVVAGWDGTTAFDQAAFDAAGASASTLAATTLFGRNMTANGDPAGDVIIGRSFDFGGTAVGSRNGMTQVFANNLTLDATGGEGGAAPVQLGYRTSSFEQKTPIDGPIQVRTRGNTDVLGAFGLFGPSKIGFGGAGYALIGHVGGDGIGGGFDDVATASFQPIASAAVLDEAVPQNGSDGMYGGDEMYGGEIMYGLPMVDAPISIIAGGDLNLRGGMVSEPMIYGGGEMQVYSGMEAQIYSGMTDVYSGESTERTMFTAFPAQPAFFVKPVGLGHSQVGHGGAGTAGEFAGNIDISAQNVNMESGNGGVSYTLIGHGSAAFGDPSTILLEPDQPLLMNDLETIRLEEMDEYNLAMMEQEPIANLQSIFQSRGSRMGNITLAIVDEVSVQDGEAAMPTVDMINSGPAFNRAFIGHGTADTDAVSNANVFARARAFDQSVTTTVPSGSGFSRVATDIITRDIAGGNVTFVTTITGFAFDAAHSFDSPNTLIIFASEDLELQTGASFTNTGMGNIALATQQDFQNDSGGLEPLMTGGRWVVYSTRPDANRNDIEITGVSFLQYGQPFDLADPFPAIPPSPNNGHVYSVTPIFTSTVDPITAVYGDTLTPTQVSTLTIEVDGQGGPVSNTIADPAAFGLPAAGGTPTLNVPINATGNVDVETYADGILAGGPDLSGQMSPVFGVDIRLANADVTVTPRPVEITYDGQKEFDGNTTLVDVIFGVSDGTLAESETLADLGLSTPQLETPDVGFDKPIVGTGTTNTKYSVTFNSLYDVTAAPQQQLPPEQPQMNPTPPPPVVNTNEEEGDDPGLDLGEMLYEVPEGLFTQCQSGVLVDGCEPVPANGQQVGN